MSAVKNKSTPEGREFWAHVERVAKEARERGEPAAEPQRDWKQFHKELDELERKIEPAAPAPAAPLEYQHHIFCNVFRTQPIGAPGCICEIIPRAELARLSAELELVRKRTAELENALREIVDYGCIDTGAAGEIQYCYFCDASLDEPHFPDCVWEAARKVLEQSRLTVPPSPPAPGKQ